VPLGSFILVPGARYTYNGAKLRLYSNFIVLHEIFAAGPLQQVDICTQM
jgi:hypothetical protein